MLYMTLHVFFLNQLHYTTSQKKIYTIYIKAYEVHLLFN